jgi:hypothetical protein
MITFHRGDRVRLTEKGARIQAHGYRRFGQNEINNKRMTMWRTRCGTVSNTPLPSSAGVSILWDGLMSPSNYPKGMVELMEDQPCHSD